MKISESLSSKNKPEIIANDSNKEDDLDKPQVVKE